MDDGAGRSVLGAELVPLSLVARFRLEDIQESDGLINECCRNPFKGTGKPEPLKYEKAWSRRIDEKNRFVYSVTDGLLLIISCRGHYGDK